MWRWRVDAAESWPDVGTRLALSGIADIALNSGLDTFVPLQDADSEPSRRTHGDGLDVDGILGRSEALRRLLERLAVVAPMESNVLLSGSSGTGKSTLARVLHRNSPRAKGPFVELNCAALPEGLVESELFGAERGAHSAVVARGTEGKVAAAEGGTLFLDEIGELPPSVQAKVLQLVQSKEYFPLGSRNVRRADVRIVAATNQSLEDAIASKAFREDLYYRLRGVQLRVPSLAERREDIPTLAQHFVAESCERLAVEPLSLSPEVLEAFEGAEWPGNIRELASVCDEAIVSARIERSDTIELRHAFPNAPQGDAKLLTLHAARQRWERGFLAAELARRDWNVAATARELDISRSHLNTLIRRYGLSRAAIGSR